MTGLTKTQTNLLVSFLIEANMTIEELHKLWDKKNKGKSAPTEHDLQVRCLRWLRNNHKRVLCYAIPNGAYTTKTTARKLVAEGVCHGIPDLHIPIARGGYHSLYIEMKNGKAGRLSEHQKEMIKKLESLGNKVVVCRSLEDFVNEVETYLKS